MLLLLLSVDIVRHAAAGHIQHAILLAGDSDFVPAVEAAKEHGVTVSLWCGTAKTVHKDLIALADEVYAFDWNTFPLISTGGEPQRPKHRPAGNQHPNPGSNANSSRRRRGGGSGRSNQGGSRPEPAAEPVSEGPKKSPWRDRLKSFTNKKED